MSRVAVVIPSVGREDALGRLLDSLARQQVPDELDWDVLIVDNATPPRARRVVERFPSLAARVVEEPRPGAAHARNRGIAETSAELVALLDDDVIPRHDWLARITAAFADPTVDGVGGLVELDPEPRRPRWLDTELATYLTQLDLGPARDLDDRDYLLTANAAFRADVVRAVSFNPQLGPRPGSHLTNDDLDLSRRLLAAGRRLVWRPDARVVHELPIERMRIAWFLKRAFAQGRSDWILEQAQMRTRRVNGIGGAVRRLIGAPFRWWRRANGTAFAMHVLTDAVHDIGLAYEGLRSLRRAQSDDPKRRPE